jgi:hypothetical protein
VALVLARKVGIAGTAMMIMTENIGEPKAVPDMEFQDVSSTFGPSEDRYSVLAFILDSLQGLAHGKSQQRRFPSAPFHSVQLGHCRGSSI